MLAISFIWKFSISNVKLKIIEREGLCERFERIDLSKIINTAGNHGQDFYRGVELILKIPTSQIRSRIKRIQICFYH